jgi:hypothetical protein
MPPLFSCSSGWVTLAMTALNGGGAPKNPAGRAGVVARERLQHRLRGREHETGGHLDAHSLDLTTLVSAAACPSVRLHSDGRAGDEAFGRLVQEQVAHLGSASLDQRAG